MKENVINLGSKRVKKNLTNLTEGDFKVILQEGKREQKIKRKLLKQKLMDSDLKAVNDPSLGEILFFGAHYTGEEDKNMYIWADDSDEAEYLSTYYADVYNDAFTFHEVIDTNGNVELF